MGEVLGLQPDWLNAGAAGVLESRLPEGFRERLRTRVYGNLVVSVLSRMDLLRLKLLAAADEGPHSQHVADVLGMRATREEVTEALRWARNQAPPEAPWFADVAAALGVESQTRDH